MGFLLCYVDFLTLVHRLGNEDAEKTEGCLICQFVEFFLRMLGNIATWVTNVIKVKGKNSKG